MNATPDTILVNDREYYALLCKNLKREGIAYEPLDPDNTKFGGPAGAVSSAITAHTLAGLRPPARDLVPELQAAAALGEFLAEHRDTDIRRQVKPETEPARGSRTSTTRQRSPVSGMRSAREMMKEVTTNTTMLLGRPFPKFPILTEMTYGLHGIFILAGKSGIGKSTLAAHLAADVVGPDYPGIYYESENRFVDANGNVRSLAIDRMKRSYGDDERFDHLWYTASYEEARDAALDAKRGFIVLDTIQGSLGYNDFDPDKDAASHNAMNRRAHDVIKLVDAGVAVLMVSHVNVRNLTGCPQMHHLKLSGALEQGAWIIGGYWNPTRDEAHQFRSFRVVKYRVEAPKGHPMGTTLRLSLGDQELLTEAGLLPRQGQGEQATQAKNTKPACPILRLLAREPMLTPKQIEKRLRMPISTVERKLREHLKAQYVVKADKGHYSLGPQQPLHAAA
jgi:hypothetical protein